MSRDAFRLVKSLMNHPDTTVTRALIFSLSVIVPVIIPHMEGDEIIFDDVMTTRQWLCDVIDAERDSKMCDGAVVVMAIIQKKLKETFEP